ncbi:MAG: hypothetical protein A2032_05860 [Chloroflexi bacterium RBG_19FT_COMBO_49_13]|nr:MAG: hypothetical protein A2032_05860 [Chloroflexi bacterium RBG_19FT_COMBO_49_13]
MNKTIVSYIGNLLAVLFVLVLIGVIFFLSIKSFPSPQSEVDAYPGPFTTSTLSPETLCDQFFSFRNGLSDAQRQMIEIDYQNCVNARKTPNPQNLTKPAPSYSPQAEYISPFLRRTAGAGKIIETNFSPLRSNYKIVNQWVADINGIHFAIYAGGRLNDTSNGSESLDDLSWAGVVVIDAADSNGNYLLDRSGVFWTPQNIGPIRIVGADSTTLTLVANTGESFLFDFDNRSFLSSAPISPVTVSIGNGVLIESGYSSYQFNDYTFINQWSIIDGNNMKIIVIAGKEREKPNIGVLELLKVSSTDNANIIEADAYFTNLDDGALRIVEIENDNIILVSESGLIYIFNLTSQQFTSLPAGSEPITSESDVLPVYNPEPGSIATKTPTRTPTPRPTKTALPTYNPYP